MASSLRSPIIAVATLMSSLSQSLSGCDSDSAPRSSMASGSELQASEPLAASASSGDPQAPAPKKTKRASKWQEEWKHFVFKGFSYDLHWPCCKK